MLQTNVTDMCGEYSQCSVHTGFASTDGVCALSIHTAQAQCCSIGSGPELVHFPGLSHSGSDSGVLHKGTDSLGPMFWAFPSPSSSGTQELVERALFRCSTTSPLPAPASVSGHAGLVLLVSLLGS